MSSTQRPTRRLLRRIPRLLLGCSVVLPLLLLLLLLSAPLYTYHRLSAETQLAELQFEPLAPQRYRATLTLADGCDVQHYLVLGDQWRVDAWFLKWHAWAALLGLDPLYRLERLEGRYQSTIEQNSRPLLAHDLHPEAKLNLLAVLGDLGALNPLFDADYGSSAYAPIDPSRRYLLYRGPSGLLIRHSALPAPRVEEDGLTITISHACGESASWWQRGAQALATLSLPKLS